MSKTQQSGHIYRAAKDFYELGILGFNDGDFLAKHVMAIVANFALSVELFLKASDAKVTPSLRSKKGPLGPAKIQSNVWGHDLLEVFNDIDKSVANQLESAFEEITNRPLLPLLEKCKDYFVNARYHYEKLGAYDVTGIKVLAEGIDAALIKSFGSTA